MPRHLKQAIMRVSGQLRGISAALGHGIYRHYSPNRSNASAHSSRHGFKNGRSLKALFRCGIGTEYLSQRPTAKTTGFHKAECVAPGVPLCVLAPSSPNKPFPSARAFLKLIDVKRPPKASNTWALVMPFAVFSAIPPGDVLLALSAVSSAAGLVE